MKAIELDKPKTVYSCPFFTVAEVPLQLENGHQFTYYLNDGRDFVVIIAEQDNQLLMVKQFRYPIQKTQLEFCAGGIDKDEKPIDAAYRELLEETGYKAHKLEHIGCINQIVARSNTTGYIYRASQLEDTGKVHLDKTEVGLEREWVDAHDFIEMLKTKQYTDGTTLASWALYQVHK